MRPSGTHRLTAVFAAATTLLLLVSGFMVSESTGLPVPAWAAGGQMAHRVVAGVVSVLALATLAAVWRGKGAPWRKRLAAGAVLIVFSQAGLGMAMARLGTMAPVSILQAMLMHVLLALVATLWLTSSRGYLEPVEGLEDELQPSLRSIAWWPVGLVLVQILLGSAYRHGWMGVVPHLFSAFVVAGALAFLAILVATTYPKHRPLKQGAAAVAWLTVGQIVLGLVALFYRAQAAETAAQAGLASWWVAFTVAHVLIGSFTLAATVWMAVQIRKYVLPAEPLPVQARNASVAELGTRLS